MGDERPAGERCLDIDLIIEIAHWSCRHFILEPRDEGHLREVAHKHGLDGAIRKLLTIVKLVDVDDAEKLEIDLVKNGWVRDDV